MHKKGGGGDRTVNLQVVGGLAKELASQRREREREKIYSKESRTEVGRVKVSGRHRVSCGVNP